MTKDGTVREEVRLVRIVDSVNPMENGRTGILMPPRKGLAEGEYRIGVDGHIRSYQRDEFEEE